MSVPAISVLMAARNGRRFLAPSLTSLVSQSFKDFEVIFVDNGSSDGSEQIARLFSDKDSRFRIFQVQRLGLARCLNFAASMSRAPLLARFDADDLLHSDRFSVQYSWLAARPDIGLLGTSVDLIDSNDQSLGSRQMPLQNDELKDHLRRGNPFIHSTIMMRREAYEAAGGYRAGLRLSEDFDLWSRMADHADMANLAARLVKYRIHQTAMSSASPTKRAIADICIIAAQTARERNREDPFVDGVPNLRMALSLLSMSRADFQYQWLKATIAAARNALAYGDRLAARRFRRQAFRHFINGKIRNYFRGLLRYWSSYFPNS